jgi:hypothetical protein
MKCIDLEEFRSTIERTVIAGGVYNVLQSNGLDVVRILPIKKVLIFKN